MAALHDTLNLPQSLGDGLILRLATKADIEPVAEFNTRIHLNEDPPPPIISIWTRDLMSGRHPTTTAADFIVVEETQSAKIVSVTCLIPQVWRYEDIPFPVGRAELVGTDPAYRRRGLVRTTFEAIHALSAAYGHLVQGITGIPWFYRQFGYEYALALGGARQLNLNDIRLLEERDSEPYPVRPATEADIPALMRLYERLCADKLVTARLDEARWRYDLSGHSPGSDQELKVYCILDRDSRVVGYYATPARIWKSSLNVWEIAVNEGVSLRAVVPSVVRALKAQAERLLATTTRGNNDKKKLATLNLVLGVEHPLYEVLEAKLRPFQKPYSWYIRVPNLPGFIRHIAPVLERRLAGSVMSGFSGDLKLSFYRSGLRLAFEQGRLTCAEDWHPLEAGNDWGGAGFPPLVFLQLLFGHRSLDELRHAFPDCWANEEPRLLLKALFPKRPSWVQPQG